MNLFFSTLYSEGFWVRRDTALGLAGCCEKFLECYGRCTCVCYQRGIHRFHGTPKCHMLCHFPLRLRAEAQRSFWVVNCLAESVQLQEDFIGRPSRLSRRVSPKSLHLRCLQRYMMAAHHALLESDNDFRGLGFLQVESWESRHCKGALLCGRWKKPTATGAGTESSKHAKSVKRRNFLEYPNFHETPENWNHLWGSQGKVRISCSRYIHMYSIWYANWYAHAQSTCEKGQKAHNYTLQQNASEHVRKKWIKRNDPWKDGHPVSLFNQFLVETLLEEWF